MKKVAVIGAGITGLSAAYYLQQQLDVDIDILEQSDRVGGKIKTYQGDGYTIELGPESYLGRKQIMNELAAEIGMADDLVTNNTGQSYIYANNKLYPMPGGSIMGIPTEVKPFLATKLLSPSGKARAGLDYFIKPKKMKTDVSVGEFFRRRLGNEALENLIEPLLSGIYGANIDRLSLKSTFPNFKEQEEAHGSLIKGMRVQKAQTGRPSTGKKKGQFRQFKNGLQSFVERLAEVVQQQGAVVKFNSAVSAIDKKGDTYTVTVNDKEEQYDGVIVTVPHTVFNRWFDEAPLGFFKYMETTSVATVVMAFDESQVNNEENGTGFVIARNSDTIITACTWTDKKWEHAAPPGKVLLRAYVGRPGSDIVKESTDEELVKLARRDLDKMMELNGEPEFTIVTRLLNSMPQYDVGHIDRVRHVQRYMEQTYPGLLLTGASFEAVGLPDCISQGKASAEKLALHLQS